MAERVATAMPMRFEFGRPGLRLNAIGVTRKEKSARVEATLECQDFGSQLGNDCRLSAQFCSDPFRFGEKRGAELSDGRCVRQLFAIRDVDDLT